MEQFKRSRPLDDDIQHQQFSPSKLSKREIFVKSSPNKKLKNISSTTSPQKNHLEKQTVLEDDNNDNIKNWFDDSDESFIFNECGIVNDENSPNNSQTIISNSNDNENNTLKKLNLEQWNRCIVKGIEKDPKNFDLILHLKEENDDKYGICRLQGPWCHTKINENDLICIKGVWNCTYDCYLVNTIDGLIVTNPDYLVSGTSVVGSLFCARKGILQDKFRGLDADNKIMVVGSIIHELLQLVLVRKLYTAEDIENAVQELLKSEEMVFTLYANKMSMQDIKGEIQKFIPNIVNFIDQYVEQKGSMTYTKEMFQGCIDKIQDIEENLCVPQLGLKGKIDVSVIARTSRQQNNQNSIKLDQKYMPLELKTGRASFSAEHKGQLILYQMMLQEIGKKVDSGLLLYLRDGIMKEIPSTRNEQRDLIMLRNELAYYLTRNINIKEDNANDFKTFEFETIELPEPINHHSACSKCPYQVICSSFLKSDRKFHFSGKNPLEIISKECTSHLTDTDLQYFVRWCGLLSLEDQEIKKSSYNIRNLWTENPEDRQKNGRALIDLKMTENVEFNEQKYLHTFKLDDNIDVSKNDVKIDFTLSGINIGDYVTVSCRKRIAIASGHVYDLNKNSIIISLERNLQQNYKGENFIVDKFESQSLNLFNYTNLGVLLDNLDEMNRLRKIIIEKMKPTFTKVLPKIIATKGKDILMSLNHVQRKAALKALSTNDYMLIKGLPGTGKTQTLVTIIRLLHLMQKSVLITSHTHSAVDNVLIRLKRYNVPFLRLGSGTRISSQIYENSEINLMKNCKSPEELDKMYSSYNIIGVTCLGSSHSIFINRKFDVCIVDEATQVFQPTTLRPLFYANKFILVGDPEQLPPVIKSKIAKNLNADETLFDRLDTNDATATLTLQYRMNKIITKLANNLTYNGNLICANETVMQANMKIPNRNELLKNFHNQKWLLRTLETHLDLSVIMLNTQNCIERHLKFKNCDDKFNGKNLQNIIEQRFKENDTACHNLPLEIAKKLNYTNYCEAAIIFYLIKVLLQNGCKAENIGIIASYRAQVELLKKLKENYQNFYTKCNGDDHNCTEIIENIDFSELEVNTVDQYQGRDKEIIFYSCTRTGNGYNDDGNILKQQKQFERRKESEILEDRRRLTVAITRSKHKLIIVGDENCLVKYKPFEDLFSKISSICKFTLEDEKFGFSWNRILEELKIVMEKI